MDVPYEKPCGKCKATKPLDAFSLDAHNRRDGRQGSCRECQTAYMRAYRERNLELIRAKAREAARQSRQANPERWREYTRRYRDAHPDRVKESAQRSAQNHREYRKAYLRTWYQQNADYQREYARQRRVAHPDRVKEANHHWYQANQAKARAGARARYAANAEGARAYARNWRIRNPEQAAAGGARRRARKHNAAIERFTRAEIATRDKFICHICRMFVPVGQRSIDHLVPLSRGGAHSRQNVALAHLICNVRRNAYGPAQLRLALPV